MADDANASMLRDEPTAAGDSRQIAISSEHDIVGARRASREIGTRLGFSAVELTLIATAISELARNIVAYAGAGDVNISLVRRGRRQGMLIRARDSGPGIRDLRRALAGGYSTCRGLGLGLSGVRRLMDEFEIVSLASSGTDVTVHKWKR
jgi:serine/threonine-protein kinase RsbT